LLDCVFPGSPSPSCSPALLAASPTGESLFACSLIL
jgi:hypothetical protein